MVRKEGEENTHCRGEKEKVGVTSSAPPAPVPGSAPVPSAPPPALPARLIPNFGACVDDDPTRPLARSTLLLSMISTERNALLSS